MTRNTRVAKKKGEAETKSESKTRRHVSKRVSSTRQTGKKQPNTAADSDAQSDHAQSDHAQSDHDESDAYVQDEDSDVESLNSDTLDDPDFDASGRKRKRTIGSKNTSPRKSRFFNKSASKLPSKKKRAPAGNDEEEYEEGVEVVGTVVQAPKTGRVPPGQISKNTLNFLKQLQKPECNDRTWFKLHEPVYRLAEKEWKDFIDEFTPLLTEADPQVPPLPPNDVVHRIYRDIRFSNDKTPYKTNFSASFSRSGRKGIFAGYHLSIKSGGSLFAAGVWCPERNELQTIRNNILRSSRRLRQTISNPAFVEAFGEPKPGGKGNRQNIFGAEDELKTAPKGIDKNHKDIDLLKCRSFCVFHNFTDREVLDPDFKEMVKRMVSITRPLVHCLNDMMTIPPDDEEPGTGSENDGND